MNTEEEVVEGLVDTVEEVNEEPVSNAVTVAVEGQSNLIDHQPSLSCSSSSVLGVINSDHDDDDTDAAATTTIATTVVTATAIATPTTTTNTTTNITTASVSTNAAITAASKPIITKVPLPSTIG